MSICFRRERWDRAFLNVSSKMAEPFCAAWHLSYRLVAPLDPQKFENCATLAQEVAVRAIIVLSAVFAVIFTCLLPMPTICGGLALGLGSKAFRAIGFAIQKNDYTHMRGRALEKSLDDSQVNLMTWNICGLGGGMSLDHGGVNHWRSRLDAIIEKINQEDPDVLILQEVYDTDLAEALIERLQDDYAHFFTHLGPNVWGMVGGTMVLSKCAVHHFSHTSFKNNDWTLNRGFATLEIKASPENTAPCARIIGTHFIHGDEVLAKNKRAKQIAQIADHVACQTLAIPTVLAGDLNMERDGEEGELLSEHLYHAYQGRAATCTNRLTAQWKERETCEETIDYISLFKRALFGAQLEECRLVEAFDISYNTKTALSDHHGLVSVLKI